MNSKKKLTVIIPARNEVGGIIQIVDAVHCLIEKTGYHVQVIVVDDGSTDGTYTRAVGKAKNTDGMCVLRLSRNFGKESAIAAGLFAADGDAAIVMDADFQHPVDAIPEMIKGWEDGCEIVEAVKTDRGQETLFSKTMSHLFYYLFKFLARFDISQATDFKLLDRKVILHWRELQEQHLFFRGMVAWLGFRRLQIPVQIGKRVEGVSKWTTFRLLLYGLKNIISFSPFLLYVVASGTALLTLLTIGIAVRAFIVKLSGQVIDGITIIILTQSLIGTGLMIGISAISIYLSLIFEELKKRPRFIISESFFNSISGDGETSYPDARKP